MPDLSWIQLTADPKRFLTAIFGAALAIAMMLFQLGLNDAFYRQVTRPHEAFRGDLFVVHSQFEYLGLSRSFHQRHLARALAIEAVTGFSTFRFANLPLKNPVNRTDRDIFIIAVEPNEIPFRAPHLKQSLSAIKQRGMALIDRLSHDAFGPYTELLHNNNPVVTELGGKRILIRDVFDLGPTFAADGNLITNSATFSDLRPDLKTETIMLGSLHLGADANAHSTAEKLRTILPSDLDILTRKAFLDREKSYWANRTPIGFVISISLIISLFVGAVIIYQILYSDIVDHLPEYATLKAIGFPPRFFHFMVLKQSMIISILGIVPAIGISLILYHFTRERALMPTVLEASNILVALLLTFFMSLLAGFLATAKLRHADPADIF